MADATNATKIVANAADSGDDVAADQQKARESNGQFVAGHRKVGGRKRAGKNKLAPDVRTLAREHTEHAVMCLVATMRDPSAPHDARCRAAIALLDRAHGKPAVSVVGADGGPFEVNLVEVRASIAAKWDRIAAVEAAKAGRVIDAKANPPAAHAQLIGASNLPRQSPPESAAPSTPENSPAAVPAAPSPAQTPSKTAPIVRVISPYGGSSDPRVPKFLR